MRTWGARGSGDGELSAPAGIAVRPPETSTSPTPPTTGSSSSRRRRLRAQLEPGSAHPGAGSRVAASGGDVYVADSGNDRIAHFAADGTPVGEWGTTGGGPGEFEYPRGISVAADGDVYVADTANDRVQQFSADGAFVREFGGHGTDFDRFQSREGSRSPRAATCSSPTRSITACSALA